MARRRLLVVTVVLVALGALAVPGSSRRRAALQRRSHARLPAPVPQRLRPDQGGPLDARPVAASPSCARPCRRTSPARRIDPREWNRNDGFSPGQPIIVHVPSLTHPGRVPRLGHRAGQRPREVHEARASRCCCSTRRPASARSCGASSTPTPVATPSRNLIIHPAKNLVPGRPLRRRAAHPARPRARAACGRRPRRRSRARAGRGGRQQASVYLTWDFTVASDRSLTARLLSIRDDAFAPARRHEPGRRRDPGPRAGLHGHQRPGLHGRPEPDDRAHGHAARSPCPAISTSAGCPPGARFHYSSGRPDALPTQIPGNVQQAPFQCNIPRAAFTTPSRIVALRPRPARRPHADRRGQHPGR